MKNQIESPSAEFVQPCAAFGFTLQAAERQREVGEAMGDSRLQAYAAWTAGRIYTVMDEGEAAIVEPPRVRAGARSGGARSAARMARRRASRCRRCRGAIAQYRELSGAGGYRSRQVIAGTLGL